MATRIACDGISFAIVCVVAAGSLSCGKDDADCLNTAPSAEEIWSDGEDLFNVEVKDRATFCGQHGAFGCPPTRQALVSQYTCGEPGINPVSIRTGCGVTVFADATTPGQSVWVYDGQDNLIAAELTTDVATGQCRIVGTRFGTIPGKCADATEIKCRRATVLGGGQDAGNADGS